VRRSVFSPALVVWSGTPSLSVSVQIGGPGVGWTPLPPRVPYRPWYRHSERHVERVDPWHPAWGPRPPRPGVPDTVWRRSVEPVQGKPTAVSP
ncbi:MAG: hypothetical protein ACKO6B_13480, partial [Planctomycetia bacterium]